MKKLSFCFLVVLFSISNLAFVIASERTGASFLKIPVGARPAGLGYGYVAIADDVNAIAWNPAGLSQLTKKEFSALYNQHFVGIEYGFTGFAFPTKLGTFGTSLIFLQTSKIESRDEKGNLTGSFIAQDSALSFAFGKEIKGSSLGVNFKIIRQKIAEEVAKGVAIDLGLLHRFQVAGYEFQVGGTIQNLGPKMKFIEKPYNLPLTISAGFGLRILGTVLLVGSVNYQIYERKTKFDLGSEYWLGKTLALRGQYRVIDFDLSKQNKFLRFAGGLGFKISNYQLDYAFVPYAELGNTQRLSFRVRF